MEAQQKDFEGVEPDGHCHSGVMECPDCGGVMYMLWMDGKTRSVDLGCRSCDNETTKHDRNVRYVEASLDREEFFEVIDADDDYDLFVERYEALRDHFKALEVQGEWALAVASGTRIRLFDDPDPRNIYAEDVSANFGTVTINGANIEIVGTDEVGGAMRVEGPLTVEIDGDTANIVTK